MKISTLFRDRMYSSDVKIIENPIMKSLLITLNISPRIPTFEIAKLTNPINSFNSGGFKSGIGFASPLVITT